MPRVRASSDVQANINQKASGGQVRQRANSAGDNGLYVAVEDGDTLCGLAKAYYGRDTADCAKLREHMCNSKLLHAPLVKGQKVYIPGIAAPPKDVQKKKVVIEIKGKVKKDLEITCLAPKDYDKIDDGRAYVVSVVDPLRDPKMGNGQVTLSVVYPEPGTAPLKYKRCPSLSLPRRKTGKQAQPLVVDDARQLVLTLGDDRSTKTFRLVTQEDDRLARPAETLLVSELTKGDVMDKVGKVVSVPHLDAVRAEILQMKVRAVYKLPSCKHGCAAGVDQPLDVGKKVTLAIKIYRKVRTAEPATEYPAPLDPMTGKPTGAVVSRVDVQNNLISVVRRIWAEAAVWFEVMRMEIGDAPSDMLTVGDWDGLWHDPPRSHLPPNGKSAAAQYTLTFKIKAKANKDAAIVERDVAVTVPAGSTPVVAAGLIADKINAVCDADVASASVNPKQSNAEQVSCDVLLRPATGYMTIENLQGGETDAAQKVYRISIDPATQAKAVVSNFPEAYHIGSPQHRLAAKTFPRKNADIKIMFVHSEDLAVASSQYGAEGFGLGQMRDFPDLRPHEEVYDSIFAGGKLLNSERPTLLAHELGHVLLDTPGHAVTQDQLMFGSPPKGTALRIIGYAPVEANWQWPQYDAAARAFNFADLPWIRMNAASRVRKEATATTGVFPRTTDNFKPLSQKELDEIKGATADVLDFIFGKDQKKPVEIVQNVNYFPVPPDELGAWMIYFDLVNPQSAERGDSQVITVATAFEAALAHGSDAIKKIILSDGATAELVRKIRAGTSGMKPADQRKFCATRLAEILCHEEMRTGFKMVSEPCAAVAPWSSSIVGYAGRYCNTAKKIDGPAMFLTLERFNRPPEYMADGRLRGYGPTRERHFYAALHEAMHLNSAGARGFHNCPDTWKPPKLGGDWRSVIDEGTTEFFARLAYYYHFANYKDGPIPACFGCHPNQYVPAYEVVKNVVAQLADSTGIKLLAEAYFNGNFEAFFTKIPADRFNDWFWEKVTDLRIDPPFYVDPTSTPYKANDELSAKYPMCLKASDIWKAIPGADYSAYPAMDPAKKFFDVIFI